MFPSMQIGGDPWLKANEGERAQAETIAYHYAEDERWTVNELSAVYECPAREIRWARYLAMHAGLIHRVSEGRYRPGRFIERTDEMGNRTYDPVRDFRDSDSGDDEYSSAGPPGADGE